MEAAPIMTQCAPQTLQEGASVTRTRGSTNDAGVDVAHIEARNYIYRYTVSCSHVDSNISVMCLCITDTSIKTGANVQNICSLVRGLLACFDRTHRVPLHHVSDVSQSHHHLPKQNKKNKSDRCLWSVTVTVGRSDSTLIQRYLYFKVTLRLSWCKTSENDIQ